MTTYKSNLYRPFSEDYQDDATNSNFSWRNLIFDSKKKIEPPKNALDAAARHFVTHGSFPTPVKPSVPVKNEEDDHEAVKEDMTMPSVYSAHLYNPLREAEGDSTGIAKSVGLGTPQSTANNLYKIPINQYHDSDASFVGDGESSDTSKTNIPALLAARNAGGNPHPLTISNGINKRACSGGFKLKPLRDDLGPNG
jgi:hypothetical protein